MHHVTASLGISFMSVTRDMRGVNFAASRSNIIEDRRFYRSLQKWFAKSFCQPEWNDFVWWMAFTDKIPGVDARRFLNDQHKYTQAWWMAEGWEWVDPSKDAQAAISMRDAGLATDKAIVGQKGETLIDHYQQLANEKQLRKEFDIEDMFQSDQAVATAEEEDKPDKNDDEDQE